LGVVAGEEELLAVRMEMAPAEVAGVRLEAAAIERVTTRGAELTASEAVAEAAAGGTLAFTFINRSGISPRRTSSCLHHFVMRTGSEALLPGLTARLLKGSKHNSDKLGA